MRLIARHPLILILVLGLVLAVPLLNEHLVPAGDNSTYLVLGQALATGRGYKMISDPRSPDMGLYPPGYPLLLAGVLALTGTQGNLLAGILPCKLLSIALYLGTLVLIYELLKWRIPADTTGRSSGPANTTGRSSGPGLATAATLLTAVNPQMLYYATEVGTEIPFLFLSLACLWVFERYVRKPTAGGLVGTVIVLVLAFYVRSIALVMAVAFALYLVVKQRPPHRTRDGVPRIRQALFLLLAVAVLEAPWFIRGRTLPDTGTAVGLGRGYFALYFTSDPYGTAPASLSDWVVRLAQNVRMYVFDIWPTVLFPHAERISEALGAVGSAFALSISLLLSLGFLLELGRGRVGEWYTVTFFASCVTYMWAQSRLVLPIIPFAIHYFLVAIHVVLELTVNMWRRLASSGKRITIYIFAAACAVLALSALVAEGRAVQRNLSYGWAKPLATYYQTSAEWTNYLQAMNWIAENGATDSAVICRKADLMYIVTGHHALEYPYSQDGMALKRSVADSDVVYIIEDAFKWTGTTTDYLRPALRAWMAAEPQGLKLVFETDAPLTRVWRVEKLD
jgi:hypothetical protein